MRRIAVGLLALGLLACPAGRAVAQEGRATALYEVQVLGNAPARVSVHAILPSDGRTLTMAQSWPGNVPELADAGWPGLVRNLQVTDPEGRAVAVAGMGPGGWSLERPVSGALSVDYQIDYEPLAAREWPASREAAFADSAHLIVVGRSMFLTTPGQQRSEVRFRLPEGWHAVVPWPVADGDESIAAVATPDDLTENLITFSREPPEALSARGFNLQIVTLGHWLPARAEVRRVLGVALRELVELIGFDGRADYVVVLLPQSERGGESFRASFALNVEAAPARGNRGDWGHTIAHEVFHYWNGWRLVGADYASSQWFQEGFTEYAASLALVSGRLIDSKDFCDKLAVHLTRYRQLRTPLDAPGTRKGPPLYSGGALTAFIWDTMLREATGGDRGVPDLLRGLMHDTDDGARPYAWTDIQQALETVAPGEWDEFHRRYIHGTDSLPFAEALARVGLRLSDGGEQVVRIEPDTAASESARRLLRAMIGGDR